MSSSLSETATGTAAAVSSSAASGEISSSSNLKIVGIILAICSGLLIGSSFVFKKKGLLRSQAGQAAGEGVAYLKSPLWWLGMTMMILGELCNFAAYAFVEAIVVTPLGALSVVICAILSSIFLKETLSFFGWLGCGLCILGSVIIALNGPKESTVGEIREFQKLFLAPGFLVYASVLIAASLVIIFFFAPKYGKKSMLWYIFVCSMIGGISVSVTTGLGASIVTSFEGNNQFKYWFIYFLLGFIVITLVTEIYYLNMALALFNTAMVTPTYYVIFTFFSMVTTIVLFQGLSASVTQIITIVMGFLVICVGITILQMSKVDPVQLSDKLDRRSTILLQAARSQTADLEEKSILGLEDPGIDALRGSFGGTVGSIMRARSRRMSQSSHRTASGFGGVRPPPPGAAAPFGSSQYPWLSGAPSPNPEVSTMDRLNGVKRHQLYDAPVPSNMTDGLSAAGATRGDDLSSLRTGTSIAGSPLRNKRPTIKFDNTEIVHQYHPTGTGGMKGERDDAGAIHEHRKALGTPGAVMTSGGASGSGSGYPPQPPMIRTQTQTSNPQTDLLSESPTDIKGGGSLRQILALDPAFGKEHGVHSAPPTSNPRFGRPGLGRPDSRDIFEKNSPSTATLLSFPSVTDSARSEVWEEGDTDSQGGKRERGRKEKKYPKGDGDDDRDESVSLWQRGVNGDDDDDSSIRGGIRLVQNSNSGGRF